MLIWLRNYRRDLLAGDIGAGIIVTLMMIPQSMAYAMVAGLPPVTGLYASILPPVAYALFGSSMVQSVGPMAITSLMIGTSLATLAPPGSALSMVLAGQMALIAGVILFLSGVFRLGFVAGFLSRPVMSGFTSGAALLIASGQLGPLLGGPLANSHLPSALIGLASLLALWLAKTYLARALAALGASGKAAEMLTKLAPVVVLVAATAAVAGLDLAAAGVKVVGEIPAGLPALALAVSAEHWQPLLMPSLLIAFMIFLSSQSAAQSLAHRRGERIVSNRELLGLGAANLASAVSGGFAVTGSISRSAVNYAAGANTPLASIISAALIVLALLVPTTWISWLPLPALAATIILAVLGMIDVATLRDAWRHDRSDAAALLATTTGVLLLGVEKGVILGVVLSLATVIWRASRPHIAVIGRIPGSEHFRNVKRHQVETLPEVLMLRIDADLFFGNVDAIVNHLEQLLKERTANGQATRDVLLVMSAVSSIDTTGLYLLNEINRSLLGQSIKLHLSEVKGPVMDRLQRSELLKQQLGGRVFLSTAAAFSYLTEQAAQENLVHLRVLSWRAAGESNERVKRGAVKTPHPPPGSESTCPAVHGL